MTDIRVMTFNIRGGSPESDGINAWPNRAALNVDTIRRHAPDLVGFQELKEECLETYKEHLPEYRYLLGTEYGRTPPFQYAALCWRSSRFELVESGGCWLSETPDTFSGSWGTTVVRSASWVKLQTKPQGPVLVHWNTHLDHRSELARFEGAKVILQKIAESPKEGPLVVMTGDFNCAPGSDVYREYQKHGFSDTFIDAGHEDSAENFTFHRFEGEQHPTVRMDWILTLDGAQKTTTRSCTIVRDNEHPLYPSDHYPVVADLQITG